MTSPDTKPEKAEASAGSHTREASTVVSQICADPIDNTAEASAVPKNVMAAAYAVLDTSKPGWLETVLDAALQSSLSAEAELRAERDRYKAKLAYLLDHSTYGNSYGMPGSDFACCFFCDAGGAPGVPFEHRDTCPVFRCEPVIDEWFGEMAANTKDMEAAEARATAAEAEQQKLARRIHNQRVALRQDWQVQERRNPFRSLRLDVIKAAIAARRAAEVERDALRDRVKVLEEALRQLEWIEPVGGYEDGPFCPSCGTQKNWPPSSDHSPTCSWVSAFNHSKGENARAAVAQDQGGEHGE